MSAGRRALGWVAARIGRGRKTPVVEIDGLSVTFAMGAHAGVYWRVVESAEAPGLYTVQREHRWLPVWVSAGPYYFLRADDAAEWARQHLWLIDAKETTK